MASSKKGKTFAVLAAVFFIAAAFFSFATYLRSFYGVPLKVILGNAVSHRTLIRYILEWFCCLALAGTLFSRNRIAVLAAAGTAVLISAVYFFQVPKYLLYSVYLFPYLALAVLAVLAVKRVRAVRSLWFIPGVLMFILSTIFWFKTYDLRSWFFYGFFDGIRNMLFLASRQLAFILGNTFKTAALLMAGLWMRAQAAGAPVPNVRPAPAPNVRPTPAVQTQATQVHSFPESPVRPEKRPAPDVKTDDIAAQLKMYKELFDSGVITREEFEAKKRQILGI